MDFIPENIEKYAEEFTDEESEILKLIDRETHLKMLMPRMLSGKLQGKLLGFLAATSGAKNIIEIGSYTGYSAVAMAEMTPTDTRIICIEKNEEVALTLKENIEKSGFKHRIEIHVEDAMKLIPRLEIQPDFIFIDADKINYLNYYQILINKLQSGGIIVADNVLWSGKVVEKIEKKDFDTPALMEFTKFVQADSRVSNVLLPVRDGLLLIRKL